MKGIIASPGIAIGKAFVLEQKEVVINESLLANPVRVTGWAAKVLTWAVPMLCRLPLNSPKASIWLLPGGTWRE